MLDSQREKLFNTRKQYISIGITTGGVVYDITPVMWERTASAFNMKVPDFYIAPEDLLDEEIMNRICSLVVQGVYIYAPLDDYSFVARFAELQDLHIRQAERLKNVDFLADLVDMSMIFLEGATLPDLDIIWQIKTSGRGFLPYRQVGLYDCNISRAPDESLMKESFSEFLVWSLPENMERDKELWSKVCSGTKRHFEAKPKKN